MAPQLLQYCSLAPSARRSGLPGSFDASVMNSPCPETSDDTL
jgi:hypothetical protein